MKKVMKLNDKAARLLAKDLDDKALENVTGGMACGKPCGILATHLSSTST